MPGAPAMLVASDEFEQALLDAGPLEHHLAIAEPDHEVSTRVSREVAASIPGEGCRIVVMFPSVDLDDQPIADEQVDPTDLGDADLGTQRDPAGTKPRTNEGLRSRFTRHHGATEHSEVAWSALESTPKFGLRHEPLLQSRVESDQGGLGA